MIFEDPSRRRWRRAVVVLALLLLSAFGTLGLAVAGVLLPVDLPDVFQKRPSVRSKVLTTWKDSYVKPVYSPKQMKDIAAKRNVERKRRARLVAEASEDLLPLPENAVVAFTVRDDPAAHASLERHIDKIDVVIPDWFSVSGPGCELEEHIDAPTQRIVERTRGDGAAARRQPLQGCLARRAVRADHAHDKERKCLVDKLVTPPRAA